MSSAYPDLHASYVDSDSADDTSNDADAPPPSAFASAPPADTGPPAIDPRLHEDMMRRHSTLCAICVKPFATDNMVLRTTLGCNHTICTNCASRSMGIRKPVRIGPCVHCAELRVAMSSRHTIGSLLAPESLYPEAQYRQCMDKLRQLLSDKYVIWRDYADFFERELTSDDISGMLGTDSVGRKVASTITSYLSNAKTVVGGVLSRDKDQTVWSAMDDAHDTIAARQTQRLPHGDEFVALMRSRGRTLSDVFDTLRYTIGHVYLAGVNHMDQLRELGFNEANAFAGGDRSVAPLVVLVERFGYNAPEHMSHMSPSQIAACHLHKCEVRAIGLTAAELVRRGATIDDIKKFSLSLSDWVCYADMKVYHALAMGFNAVNTAVAYVDDCYSDLPGHPGTTLYREICRECNAEPLDKKLAKRESKKRHKSQKKSKR